MNARWRSVAFWPPLLVLALAHGIVLWHSVTAAPLWEDEAFNLTVPVNLLAGLGYTSDGTLSGSELTPFDPRISTGPVVLLPIAAVLATGADLVVGARLIPAAFFVALLIAVAILGHRIAGRVGVLVAVAVPLVFSADALPSPIQGPADILGEVPAAALLAWAAVALQKRPWLAGLLFGAALQAKYISLLALPAFGLGFLLLTIGVPWVHRLRKLILVALTLALPTAVVETVTLATLGWTDFIEHLRAVKAFLLDGGQSERATIAEKISALLDSWHAPPLLVAAMAVIAIALLVWAAAVVLRRARRDGAALLDVGADGRVALLVLAGSGLLTYLLWWLTAGHLPAWVRHPAPGILAFAPIAAAAVAGAVRLLRSRRGPGGRIALVLGVSLGAALAVSVGVAAVDGVQHGAQRLSDQRSTAATIAEAGEDWIATEWGWRVSLVVLSGAHVALTDAPADVVGEHVRLTPAERGCDAIVVEAPPVLVCAP